MPFLKCLENDLKSSERFDVNATIFTKFWTSPTCPTPLVIPWLVFCVNRGGMVDVEHGKTRGGASEGGRGQREGVVCQKMNMQH